MKIVTLLLVAAPADDSLAQEGDIHEDTDSQSRQPLQVLKIICLLFNIMKHGHFFLIDTLIMSLLIYILFLKCDWILEIVYCCTMILSCRPIS